MTDVPACNHTKVFITPEGNVRCQYCVSVWYLPHVLAAHAAEETDRVAALGAAMIWDLHERAMEKYGAQVANALHPNSDPLTMFQYTFDTCPPPHEFNAGKCVNCGISMFLGRANDDQ